MTTNVLILCTHNCARSVLGEGMLNQWAQRLGRINPLAREMLNTAGIDTAVLRSKCGDAFIAPAAGPS